jgi:hypothetical protein
MINKKSRFLEPMLYLSKIPKIRKLVECALAHDNLMDAKLFKHNVPLTMAVP